MPKKKTPDVPVKVPEVELKEGEEAAARFAAAMERIVNRPLEAREEEEK